MVQMTVQTPDRPPPMFPSRMHFSQRPHEVEQRDLQISTAGISFADHVLMVNGQRSMVDHIQFLMKPVVHL